MHADELGALRFAERIAVRTVSTLTSAIELAMIVCGGERIGLRGVGSRPFIDGGDSVWSGVIFVITKSSCK